MIAGLHSSYYPLTQVSQIQTHHGKPTNAYAAPCGIWRSSVLTGLSAAMGASSRCPLFSYSAIRQDSSEIQGKARQKGKRVRLFGEIYHIPSLRMGANV